LRDEQPAYAEASAYAETASADGVGGKTGEIKKPTGFGEVFLNPIKDKF